MIIRRLIDAKKSPRHVQGPGWESTRLLLAGDRMGFSFHVTTIHTGAALELHYRNHLESVYCIAGEGSIEDLATGEVHAVEPGTVYALDRHDRHVLRARREMTMACVFNPPLHGREVHDESGAYAADDRQVALQ